MARQSLTGDENIGKWFDPEKAERWDEDTYWNGNNHISKATGSQWAHQRLYKTAKGKFVLHSWSQWQGSQESWEPVSDTFAYKWLISNGHGGDVPKDVLNEQEV